jgi:hypothetical protein
MKYEVYFTYSTHAPTGQIGLGPESVCTVEYETCLVPADNLSQILRPHYPGSLAVAHLNLLSHPISSLI